MGTTSQTVYSVSVSVKGVELECFFKRQTYF